MLRRHAKPLVRMRLALGGLSKIADGNFVYTLSESMAQGTAYGFHELLRVADRVDCRILRRAPSGSGWGQRRGHLLAQRCRARDLGGAGPCKKRLAADAAVV